MIPCIITCLHKVISSFNRTIYINPNYRNFFPVYCRKEFIFIQEFDIVFLSFTIQQSRLNALLFCLNY
ncbi:unnamed protein product [Heterobilharzia americana]|nr:unnamed protein product [Heterobilharzia americana]CAH8450041.1 unnamed protein product [Heterobilharzia americana]